MKKLLILSVLVLTLGAACGDDDPEVAAADETESDTATVEVALEVQEARFIEGFELTIRFETGDGTEIETVDWTEFVQSRPESDPPTLDVFYESVLSQEVPAGPVKVISTMEIGMSGGPFDPCTTELDLAGGDAARVVLAFDGTCSAE